MTSPERKTPAASTSQNSEPPNAPQETTETMVQSKPAAASANSAEKATMGNEEDIRDPKKGTGDTSKKGTGETVKVTAPPAPAASAPSAKSSTSTTTSNSAATLKSSTAGGGGKRKRPEFSSSSKRNAPPPPPPTTGATSIKAAAKTTFSGFWGNGRRNDESRRVEYEGLNLTIGNEVYEIGVGDAVMLRTYPDTACGSSNKEATPVAAAAAAAVATEYTADAHADAPLDYYNSAAATEDSAATPAGMASTADADGDVSMHDDATSDAATAAAAVVTTRDPKTGDNLMLARVERVWQEKGRGGKQGQVLFQARWFLKKDDVSALPMDSISGSVPTDVFFKRLTEHDVVLSNQCDDNHVTTICGLIQVLYRHPDADSPNLPSHILPSTYLCRFSLTIGEQEDNPEILLVPYTGENDDWGEMTIGAVNPPATRQRSGPDYNEFAGSRLQDDLHQDQLDTASIGNSTSFPGGTDDESESEMSFVAARSKKQRRSSGVDELPSVDEGIDEGTTEQRDIRVGKEHQVFVPPFVANQRPISRNPTLLWTSGGIEQEGLDQYMEKVTEILTPILREHSWTQEDPHVPFPVARLEDIAQSLDTNRLPTLSSISTASSLSTEPMDALREFDCDAILHVLHVSSYDINKALAAVKATPRDYVTIWMPQQKAVFNSGFRRFSGSLRAIFKDLKSEKSLEDVIDYHYRFKIPYQFNRFQDRKREQAVRMLECIETRRSLDAPILVPPSQRPLSAAPASSLQRKNGSEAKMNGQDWAKTSLSSVAISVEERRSRAKELLLDVEAQLGSKKLIEVFKVLEASEETPLLESKTKLLSIFRGHKELQSRALEFLPQTHRL